VDQAELLRKKAQERRDTQAVEHGPYVEGRPVRVIAVTSGKGGVGKTNVSANLAVALAKLGKKVLVFDTDLGLANIDLVLGMPKPEFSIHDVLDHTRSVKDVVLTGPHGIMVLPASSGVDEAPDLDEAQRMDLVAQFENWDEQIDVMILDTGAGISPNVMYFNTVAQHIMVVATPEPTSITDAYALMKVMATKYQERRFHLLVNQVRDEAQAKEVFKAIVNVADRFGLDISVNFIGFVPSDPNVTRAVRRRTPIINAFPQSPAALSFANLAESVLDLEIPKTPKGSMQFLWRHVLHAG
jgi:flagellar biosynthesis protein FlhG